MDGESIKKVKIINTDVLAKSGIKPKLTLGEEHEVKQIYVCNCEQQHYDIGLKSAWNFISCYKCGEELPKSDTIHWINSIRTEEVNS